MNILYINKFFHVQGGVDRNFFDIGNLMEKKDHNVAYFSSKSNPLNKNEWDKYFVSYLSYTNKSIYSKLKFGLRIYYSAEARRKVSIILDEFRPDIVHIHSYYHHLSPSILPEIKKRNIPIVQSLGDYHIVSPNYNLFHNGKICEISKPDRYYKAILHKCVKNSYVVTSAEVLEKYVHRWLGWERYYIGQFIVPSRFMKKKLIEYGLSADNIKVLPHFIDSNSYKDKKISGNYILYFGRLSEEKGLKFLLKAMSKLPGIKLKIAGSWSDDKELRRYIYKHKIRNADLVGFKEANELRDLIFGCKFSILPSLWYEVFGLSIIESFAAGKAVIASNIGGIREVIKNNYNGLLFNTGDEEDLIRKINLLWNNSALCRTLGRNARKSSKKDYNGNGYYQKLIKIYKNLI